MKTRGRRRQNRKGGGKLEKKEEEKDKRKKKKARLKEEDEMTTGTIFTSCLRCTDDVKAKKWTNGIKGAYSYLVHAVLEDARCRNNDIILHVENSFTGLRYHCHLKP